VPYPLKFKKKFEKSNTCNLRIIPRYYPSTAPLYYSVALERYFDISIPLNAIDVNLEIFGKTA
jgi:hypothetical protein